MFRMVVVKPLVGIDRGGGLTRIRIGATLVRTPTGEQSTFIEVLCLSCGKSLQVDEIDLEAATERLLTTANNP